MPIKDPVWTPVRVGLLLSLIVLAGFFLMALQRNCKLLESAVLECRSNLDWFLSSPPNEIGDTLAGFAGALAFVWIVITVWIQSVELREQRQVLIAQRKEFEEMAAAQKAQVRALEAQALIFEDEKVSRDQTRVGRTLNELLEALIDHLRFANLWFSYEDLTTRQSGTVGFFAEQETRADFLRLVTHNALGGFEAWNSYKLSPSILFETSPHIDVARLNAACSICDRIEEMKPRMAEDDLVRVERYRIGELREVVSKLLDDPDLVGELKQ